MTKKNQINSQIEKMLIFVVLNITKNILIVAFNVTKTTIKEILNIKAIIIKNPIERYMFIACTLATLIIIVIYGNYKYMALALFSYFLVKSIIKETLFFIKRKKDSAKIKKNRKKYSRLREMLNNKIDVVEAHPNKVVIFSNEMTQEELMKSRSKMELFFNKKISLIKRKNGNFRYSEIIFHQETKFEQFYFFEQYLNYIDISKIKKMELPMIVGIDENNKYLMRDLVDDKYLFISGEAGGGKSVALNCIIQSLMVFTQNVVHIMIDLKEGVELSDYIKFPNCVIISNHVQFKELISCIKHKMVERLRIIRDVEKCKNIQQYNAKKGHQKMNYIVIYIDEVATIKIESNGTKRSDEESDLLQILQKGRAAGVHVIAAAQRPATEQINSDVRAGFQKAISFKITTPETQRMAKIAGTEELKEGEFKTDLEGNKEKVYKGFYISDEEIKKKKKPMSNGVYDDLYHALVKKGFFIEIQPKKQKKVNFFLKILQKKLNKGYSQIEGNEVGYNQFIKNPDKSVLKDIRDIKTKANIIDFSIENKEIIHGGNNPEEYKKLLKYIYNNYNKNNYNIPLAKEIEKDCEISYKKRNNLLKDAETEEYIKKASKTQYKINLDCVKWKEVEMKS